MLGTFLGAREVFRTRVAYVAVSSGGWLVNMTQLQKSVVSLITYFYSGVDDIRFFLLVFHLFFFSYEEYD